MIRAAKPDMEETRLSLLPWPTNQGKSVVVGANGVDPNRNHLDVAVARVQWGQGRCELYGLAWGLP